MYTGIKQKEPFIPKIKKRNINDVSELSEVKVEENYLPPDDNFSIPGSQNKNNDSTQMIRNPASARQRVAVNLGTMGNDMNDSLAPKEAQPNNVCGKQVPTTTSLTMSGVQTTMISPKEMKCCLLII